MNECISKQGSNNVASAVMYRCSSLSLIRGPYIFSFFFYSNN